MVGSDELWKMVTELFSEQLFAVLSTRSDQELHSVLVAFAPSDDLREIVFVTPRHTRKFENISKHNYVSLFADNRSNDITDLQRLLGVEARGTVKEMESDQRTDYRQLFVSKYPKLNWFVDSPGSAIMRLSVQRYDVVHHFQNVTVLEMQ